VSGATFRENQNLVQNGKRNASSLVSMFAVSQFRISKYSLHAPDVDFEIL
jgi:hypothetical protein